MQMIAKDLLHLLIITAKFIPNFAEIAYPLNQLSRKSVEFRWDEKCQTSFEKLKTALINPPVLEYPDFSPSNTFILTTDASGYAIGAVLSNSNNKPIAYASRTLNPAEIKYPTIHKELLSITWAVNHFRPYLYGRKFKICTDHCPLIYLFGMNVHNVPGQYTPYEPIFGKKSVLRSNILNNFDPIYNFESYINELKFRLRIAWKDAKDNLVASKIKRKAIADKKAAILPIYL
ncbi:RNase H-like domain found in reverse transcriptase [Popillia japonica]|uniref:RNase H-like domain found in reverse transcriptase n=1 Tax=Popillia japonica TaxID=7064 RepID=A0AAW1LQW0_POPJA